MRNIKVIFVFVFCVFSQMILAQSLSPDTFWEMKKTQHPIIIDVRTPQEFRQGKIDDAINIPVQEINLVSEIVTKKDLPIILYCRSGHRAGIALRILKKQGYTHLYNAGGLNALLAAKK